MDRPLTELELVVMAAVLRTKDDAYGVRIAEEISARTGRDLSIGTLYRTLKRLEERGYLSSTVGDATAERGGRAKTFYRVEGPGLTGMRDTVRDLGSMLDGLQVGWEGAR